MRSVADGTARRARWHPPAGQSLLCAGAVLGIALAVFLQAPGLILPETKLDLVVDPVGFLGRATHLWDGQAAFGQIQNQAAGYLLPMGPFYAAGHAMGVPGWVVQRTWITLLLVLAGIGLYRLARALGVGTPGSAAVAGLAYALSPAVIGLVAFQSGGQVAYAAAPWILLPLVTGWAGGSARTAAARSGLAVALAGGVNATSTLAALVLPALWLLARPAGARRLRFACWWAASLVLATAWWVLPLLLQSRYGLEFTKYTETAAITTSTMSLEEVLRGTGNWLGYLVVPGGRWLPGAWETVSSVVCIVGSAAVAALGLAGLSRRDQPHRGPLVAAAAIGVVAMAAAYGGALGGPLSVPLRDALDGGLAPLRNVFKLQPALRVPLAIGLAHEVAVLARLRVPRLSFGGRAVAAATVTVALVVVGAAPLVHGRLPAEGSFASVPSYWEEAARWVADHGGDDRTLLVPASAFGEYRWGRPLDEPMQALATSPWVVRDLIPLGSEGATRLLDAVELALEAGRPSPGLAQVLARAGVRYVLARNDLDPVRVDSPAPGQVRSVLQSSQGFALAASFGPTVVTTSGAGRIDPAVRGPQQRSIEVYEVTADGEPARAMAYPAAGALVVSGGPETVLQLADGGLLDPEAATVLAGDAGAVAGEDDHWVVSDALARRDVTFGYVHDNRSYVLGATEEAPGGGDPKDRLPVEGVEHQAVAVQAGAAAIRSSSYATTTHPHPEAQPSAAFDGNRSSAWVPAGRPSVVGEWVEIDLGETRSLTNVTIVAAESQSAYDGRITAVDVSTAVGSVRAALEGDEPATVELPAGATPWLRVTVASAEGGGVGIRSGGIAEVELPGVTLDRRIATPADRPEGFVGSPDPIVVLSRGVADPYSPARSDEEPRLRRVVELPDAAVFGVSGTALPAVGSALDELLASLADGDVAVDATSSWYDRPAFAPWRALDGDDTTAWVTAPDDFNPELSLQWDGAVRVDRLQLVPAGGRTEPIRRVEVQVPGQPAVTVAPDAHGEVMFPAVLTDELTVSFPSSARTSTGVVAFRLVGVAEIEVPALDGRLSVRPRVDAAFSRGCEDGLDITIDGRAVRLAVDGSVEDLVELRPLRLVQCTGGALSLAAGRHEIDGAGTGPLVASTLTLGPPVSSSAPTAGRGTRPVTVTSWSDERRRIDVGAGEAAFLTLDENFGDGWRASLDGKSLEAVRIDGWRQGFVVPSGAGGEVVVDLPPGRVYRLGLVVGGVLLLVLLALALPPRRTQVGSTDAEASGRSRPVAVAVAAFVAVALVGGPLALVVPLLLVVPDRARMLPRLAGASFALAGLLVVLDPGRIPASDAGAFGATVQVLAVLALAALLTSGVPLSNRSRRR